MLLVEKRAILLFPQVFVSSSSVLLSSKKKSFIFKTLISTFASSVDGNCPGCTRGIGYCCGISKKHLLHVLGENTVLIDNVFCLKSPHVILGDLMNDAKTRTPACVEQTETLINLEQQFIRKPVPTESRVVDMTLYY